MATSLSSLPKLECLVINFKSTRLHPDRALPVQTRFVLPVLTMLEFKGWQGSALITFRSDTTHHSVYFPCYAWKIVCEDMIRQVIYVAQICGQIPPFHSRVKSLIIKWDTLTDINDPTLWLQLFHSFPSLQSLQIPVTLEPSIASALERPTEGSPGAAEVFPSLHSLSIVGKTWGGAVEEPIQSFVEIRQRSGRPVALSRI
ncbi:hypothetical protein BGW80DRAFT_817172 [Lactifluus volemus]|nr:hypothetical protein BGW80DRAFT_817172 [Lactifluus volemus]